MQARTCLVVLFFSYLIARDGTSESSYVPPSPRTPRLPVASLYSFNQPLRPVGQLAAGRRTVSVRLFFRFCSCTKTVPRTSSNRTLHLSIIRLILEHFRSATSADPTPATASGTQLRGKNESKEKSGIYTCICMRKRLSTAFLVLIGVDFDSAWRVRRVCQRHKHNYSTANDCQHQQRAGDFHDYVKFADYLDDGRFRQFRRELWNHYFLWIQHAR